MESRFSSREDAKAQIARSLVVYVAQIEALVEHYFIHNDPVKQGEGSLAIKSCLLFPSLRIINSEQLRDQIKVRILEIFCME